MEVILQNEIKCLKCGDQIYSANRHNFKKCKCGAVGVDGGMSYLRRIGNPEDYVDLSIVIDAEVYSKARKALKWAKENQRNELGALCAVFRAFRSAGHKLEKTDEYEENIR